MMTMIKVHGDLATVSIRNPNPKGVRVIVGLGKVVGSEKIFMSDSNDKG